MGISSGKWVVVRLRVDKAIHALSPEPLRAKVSVLVGQSTDGSTHAWSLDLVGHICDEEKDWKSEVKEARSDEKLSR